MHLGPLRGSGVHSNSGRFRLPKGSRSPRIHFRTVLGSSGAGREPSARINARRFQGFPLAGNCNPLLLRLAAAGRRKTWSGLGGWSGALRGEQERRQRSCRTPKGLRPGMKRRRHVTAVRCPNAGYARLRPCSRGKAGDSNGSPPDPLEGRAREPPVPSSDHDHHEEGGTDPWRGVGIGALIARCHPRRRAFSSSVFSGMAAPMSRRSPMSSRRL